MSNAIASNKKAFVDYAVLESFECGIELKGSEVKSLRMHKVNLDDSFARVDAGEIFLYNAHISPYAEASYLNVEPMRVRKLLLHRNQINKLAGRMSQRGLTLIPLKMYFNLRGLAKVELALCKGKKHYDKRQDLKRKDEIREVRRAMKNRRR